MSYGLPCLVAHLSDFSGGLPECRLFDDVCPQTWDRGVICLGPGCVGSYFMRCALAIRCRIFGACLLPKAIRHAASAYCQKQYGLRLLMGAAGARPYLDGAKDRLEFSRHYARFRQNWSVTPVLPKSLMRKSAHDLFSSPYRIRFIPNAQPV